MTGRQGIPRDAIYRLCGAVYIYIHPPDRVTKAFAPSGRNRYGKSTEKIDRFISDVTWKSSTSPEYAEWPHSYIVREKLSYTKTSTFDYFSWWIVHYGTLGRFYNTTNYYWEHDGWVYWAMDNIINRYRPDHTYKAREAAGTLPEE